MNLVAPLAEKCGKPDILQLRSAAQYKNIQRTKIPHVPRTRIHLYKENPLKHHTKDWHLKEADYRENWKDLWQPDSHMCMQPDTATTCRCHRGAQRPLPGVTRHTGERTSYTVIFKFINTSI